MITITGEKLTIEQVVKIARHNEKIVVPKNAIKKIQKSRNIVEKKIEEKTIMYGVTTGIGELAEVVLSPKQVEQFQKFLIYSHSVSCGNPIVIENVRAAMLTRINLFCKGFSGVRPIIVKTLEKMINKNVTPIMYQKGSVGACGDLSTMSQMALVLIGEGEAIYKGERLKGAKAMQKAGIPTITFKARDGLATINGANVIMGMSALQVHDSENLLKTSEIAAAITLESLNANMTAYDERIHKLHGHMGAIECAENIRKITEKSELLKQKGKKVQDAYSMRSIPQVIGAAKDTLKFSRKTVSIELNGAGDNPLFFESKGGICLSGANFQATPLAFALEFIGTAITTICVMTERRINRLLNPHLNAGLPAYLIKSAGLFSGLMIIQYTADALVCENRVLANPAATGSIPAAADQEDFVSMGMTTAIKTRQILDNANAIIAIELIAGAQALDFRKPLKPGKGTQIAYEVVRKYVKYLKKDRPLCEDINKLTAVVKSGELVDEVEKVIGKLK